ncbi:MAG: tRNA threonylcarbamoyladenosine dehydratase [bacterium]|nr:tRNA threonylcarbamoyladenosine dehydratase [bacterium]
MSSRFSRTEMLFGKENMEKLRNARIAVFGVGGVGGYVVEALARSGVGAIDVFDDDTVSPTNLNRQIIAVTDAIGREKTELIRERATAINPEIKITEHKCFYMPYNADAFDLSKYSYIVDAIDTVTAKIELAVRAEEAGVPIISSMGTGNKIEASMLETADIYETSVCPLARVMRRELKKRGIKSLKVVYSKEKPISVHINEDAAQEKNGAERNGMPKKSIPGSTAFVPAAAGLIIAGEVVKAITWLHGEAGK